MAALAVRTFGVSHEAAGQSKLGKSNPGAFGLSQVGTKRPNRPKSRFWRILLPKAHRKIGRRIHLATVFAVNLLDLPKIPGILASELNTLIESLVLLLKDS